MLSKRFTTMLLSGAAVAGLAATSADAAMVMGLRATLKNGVALSGGDTATSVNVAVGDVITFIVYADITNAAAGGTPVFSSASGSLLSTGGTKGNMVTSQPAAQSMLLTNNLANGSGSSRGLQQDLDGDGDLDVGSNNDSVPDGFVALRTALPGGEAGPNSTNADGTSAYAAGQGPTAIANGFEYIPIRRLVMTVTDVNGDTSVQWAPRTQSGNTWFENATQYDVGDGVDSDGNPVPHIAYSGGIVGQAFSLGNAVILHGAGGGIVPEPTLGMAALAGLGLLGRRNKKA